MTAPVSFRDRYTRSEWVRLWIVLAVIAAALVAGISSVMTRAQRLDKQRQCDRMAPLIDNTNRSQLDWWELNCHF